RHLSCGKRVRGLLSPAARGRHSTFGKRSASAPFGNMVPGMFGIMRRSEKMLGRDEFPAGIFPGEAEY
ncbi:MAG: hypothetical protein IJ343_12515, partial [Clostridia bacterium]|nr:hypothetical protein [Clostridia bacterium]